MALTNTMQKIKATLDAEPGTNFNFTELAKRIGSSARGVAAAMNGLYRRGQLEYCRRVNYKSGEAACLD